ncbi:FAD-dependent oxidoreductase, partial [Duodenibacillus massiliensis]
MTDMSRRSLIQGSLALGAAGFIGAAEASTQAKVPSKWDATYDVVVVGSGFAGLAAAIEAKKAGASCVVLEKMPTAGGNSIINGGILTATGCPQQLKHGIKDSPELLAKDMLVAG